MQSPLRSTEIETRSLVIGQNIFKEASSLLSADFWQTKLMELTTSNDKVKVQLFRFVDVLPVLQTQELKRKHLLEYLSKPKNVSSWPLLLKMVSAVLHTPLQSLVVSIADQQVKKMAQRFIVGQKAGDVLPKVKQLRDQKLAFTLDILGEAVLSEVEAKEHRDDYYELIDQLGSEAQGWPSMPECDDTPLGPIPPVNVSIKVSAFDSQIEDVAFEDSIQSLIAQIVPILKLAVAKNVFINFDMEQYSIKNLTRELFKRLLMREEFRSYRHFGIVNQAYLTDAVGDAEDWVSFAKKRGTPFSIRLVKGAYWDYETILADQNGWDRPVFSNKWESDVSFEKCSEILLEAYPHIELALGSHNVRSISYAMAYAEALGLDPRAYEIQMLYGMSGAFKNYFLKNGLRIREYCPMGEMIPGLSYLVRRLLENTANDSFLKQSFMDKKQIQDLLKNPHPSKLEVQ